MSKVAIVKTTPQTVLQDVQRVMQLAEVTDSLKTGATTILKNNLSWHLMYPSANTTPWQLEGTILCLRKAGFEQGERFALPGGGQDLGETLEQALNRECVEEIGTQVEIRDLVYVADCFKPRTKRC